MTFRHLLFVLCCFCSAALFSCQRDAYYAFRSTPSAYHGPAPQASATQTPQPDERAAAPADAQASVVAEPDLHLSRPSYRAELERAIAAPAREGKLSWAQQLAVKKALKIASKATRGEKQLRPAQPEQVQKPQLDQNLKLFLIFLIVALIASLFSSLLGLLLFVVALVFLLLWVMTL